MDVDRLQKSVLARYASSHELERYSKRSTEGLRNWERVIAEQYLRKGKVLSIGCGAGRESFALEELGFAAFGVDIVAAQIENARRKAIKLGSSADFRIYDGSSLPFEDASFVAVTMWSQVLGNVPGATTRLSLLMESFRVLTVDGTLSISVHDREKTMALLVASADLFQTPVDGEPGDLILDTASGVPCYWHYFTSDELAEECEKAGFAVELLTSSGLLGQDWDNLDIVVCRKLGTLFADSTADQT